MGLLLNRACANTSTTGTGTITLGSAATPPSGEADYLSWLDAGAVDGQLYSYLIQDGADSAWGVGAVGSSGTTLTRDANETRVVAGVVSVAALSLSGSATVACVALAADLNGWRELAFYDFAVTGAVASVVADVRSCSEASVTFVGVSAAATSWCCVQVSTDGGSTYLTASGDYQTISGTGTLTAETALYMHSTSSASARYASGVIRNLRSSRSHKPAEFPARSPMLIPTTNPITHIRAVRWTTSAISNTAGGTIQIHGR